MGKNFWEKLKKPACAGSPIMIQAPMSGITDQAFRLVLLKRGKPDVFFTEFISSAALSAKKAQKYCSDVLKHCGKEKPIVAQIFGADPWQIENACMQIVKMGFDGVDINMGCPDRNVEKQGAGSALIKNPELAGKVIVSAKKSGLPVSVKTRIGYKKDEIEKWIPVVLRENVSALTVHFRAKEHGYNLPANWELAKKVVKLRNKLSPGTLIIGNGDVKNLQQAKNLAKKYCLDGIMVGRALVGNPWFFTGKSPSVAEILDAIVEHVGFLRADQHFDSIKKHFHAYCKNFAKAKELRQSLMEAKTAKQAKDLVEKFRKNLIR